MTQKAKSASEIKLFALILYLSDLKLNPKRSPSTLAYSLPFRRNASLWQGIGRNFFDLREETSQRILELLLELTTYKYGRRFIPM